MYANITPDPSRINIFTNGNLMATVHPNDPLVHWLKLAADWQTLTPKAQAAHRPIITRAVQHLFKQLSDDYEPGPIWYDEELYEHGTEALARIGGTWDRNKLTPYVLILHAIGLSDDEIADLLGPIHEKNILMAYGGGALYPEDLTAEGVQKLDGVSDADLDGLFDAFIGGLGKV